MSGPRSGRARGGPLRTRLRDGSPVVVREVADGDLRALSSFLAGLSLEARRLRFFTGGIDTARIAPAIAATGPGRLGLIASDADGTILGHALSIELGDGRAEVAVEVADAMHGLGLGTILVERLAQLDEQRGVHTLVAQVLPDNREMLDVFRDGFDARVSWREGVDAVEFPAAAWRLARRRYPPPRRSRARPVRDEADLAQRAD